MSNYKITNGDRGSLRGMRLMIGLAVLMTQWITMPVTAQEGQPQGPGKAKPDIVGILPATPQGPMNRTVGADRVSTADSVGLPSAELPGQTNLGGDLSTQGPYTLGPDDVVYIEVRGQPEFTGSYVIGHDGKIQYGIAGDLLVDGLTKEQLADAVKGRLVQYVRFPDVNVIIVQFNSKAIYILGQVASAGKYAMRGDTIKIRDALVAAGLESDYAALRRVKVIKPTDEGKKPETIKLNLKDVMYKGEMKDNIELTNGDVVVVPTTVWGHLATFLRVVFSPVVRVAKFAAF